MKVVCINEKFGGPAGIPTPKMLENCTVIEVREFTEFDETKPYYKLAEYLGPFQIPGVGLIEEIFYLSDNFMPLQNNTTTEKTKEKKPELVEAYKNQSRSLRDCPVSAK